MHDGSNGFLQAEVTRSLQEQLHMMAEDFCEQLLAAIKSAWMRAAAAGQPDLPVLHIFPSCRLGRHRAGNDAIVAEKPLPVF